jgi:N,N-dimethylformamidase beta subunit-like, C-terminal
MTALLGALSLLLVVLALLGAVAGSGRFAAALTLALAPTPSSTATASAPALRQQPTSGAAATIAQENSSPGTTDWLTPPGKRSTTQIQMYLSATSVRPGAALSVFVSVQTAGALFSIDIFRLGWYGGKGARRVLSAGPLVGEAQGYYDLTRGRLVNCVTCSVDGWLGLVEANWRSSYEVTIPSDWITGVYLVKVTDAHGYQTWAPFDVLGHDHATYVMVTSDTTVAAYNEWGGASLYLWRLPGGLGGHARKVSLDRPIAGWGDEQGLTYEIDGIRWLERNGYDVSYMSSVDLHERPEQLLGHRAYLVFGHDEYWSAEMRDGLERARDAGVGLGFFGGNIGYWQIRFEPNSHGAPDRTIVNYKEANLDPLLARDRAHVTTQWRDPIIGRPENALIGVMYAGFATQPRGFAWRMGGDSSPPLLQGTRLRPGQTYGCDLVGGLFSPRQDIVAVQ